MEAGLLPDPFDRSRTDYLTALEHCEAKYCLYSVRLARPRGLRPGDCPRRQELCAGRAASRLNEEVLEAPE